MAVESTHSPNHEEPEVTLIDPSIIFKNITFSDGTTISLDPTDIVVLVGPNNAGKSAALRELEICIGSQVKQTIVLSASTSHKGSADDLRNFLEPIREVVESNESDVIPCWALDSQRSAPCGHPTIAALRTAAACVTRAI